jgi:myo-inositol-1(or 4)-monophosphatase
MEADLALLRNAAAQAGRIAMRYFRNDPKVSWKAGLSPVTEADLHANACLHETLMAARPDYGWLSEESEDNAARLSRRRTFVVDPIDGTKAFIEGRDLWCVSVAVVENGRPLTGVLDCPARGEVFEAARGQGSFLNGRRLGMGLPQKPPRMSGAKALVSAYADAAGINPEHTSHVPSLAYRIAIIADNRLDATFIKPNAHDWDLAAADLILSESGGELLTAMGQAPRYAGVETVHGLLVAGQKSMTGAMLSVVAQTAFV